MLLKNICKGMKILRRGYIDPAVSKYPIGYTIQVELKKWIIAVVTRKTKENNYIYFLKIQNKEDGTKRTCIIVKRQLSDEEANEMQVDLRNYKPFNIEKKRSNNETWQDLTSWMNRENTGNVMITLRNLKTLKSDVGNVVRILTSSATKFDRLDWVGTDSKSQPNLSIQ